MIFVGLNCNDSWCFAYNRVEGVAQNGFLQKRTVNEAAQELAMWNLRINGYYGNLSPGSPNLPSNSILINNGTKYYAGGETCMLDPSYESGTYGKNQQELANSYLKVGQTYSLAQSKTTPRYCQSTKYQGSFYIPALFFLSVGGLFGLCFLLAALRSLKCRWSCRRSFIWLRYHCFDHRKENRRSVAEAMERDLERDLENEIRRWPDKVGIEMSEISVGVGGDGSSAVAEEVMMGEEDPSSELESRVSDPSRVAAIVDGGAGTVEEVVEGAQGEEAEEGVVGASADSASRTPGPLKIAPSAEAPPQNEE